MDFSLRSFAQAFESARNDNKFKKFSLYAFILATPADKNVFPELLTHLLELHHLTGDQILVVSPRITMNKAPDQPMDALEISEVLATKKFFNYWGPAYVDVSDMVNKFLDDQTKQTYRFARFINLDLNEIPCLVFFDSLESPEKYLRWSIQGTSASDVIKDFREVIAVIQKARKENKDPDILSAINLLDKKRFAMKVLRKVGEVAPDWISLLKL